MLRMILAITTLCVLAPTTSAVGAGELKFIIFLHRHGDRGPVHKAPAIPQAKFDQDWPLGEGQLTGKGMGQLYRVGRELNARYVGPNAVNPNFLNPTWDWREYQVRSTDVNRTLQSAESLLYGLYPPGLGQKDRVNVSNSIPNLYQPIPITTLPTSEDRVLRGVSWAGKYCPNYQKKQDAYEQTDAYKKKNADNQALYKRLGDATGWSVTKLDDVYGPADTFYTEKVHGYNNFPQVSDADKQAAIDLVSFWAKAETSDKEERMMMSGVLMGRIIEHMQEHIEGRSIRKAVHYSGHDSTVFPLLAALGIFDGTNPPYGSHIVFEVRESKDATGAVSRFVESYFLDKIVTFPWCNNQTSCPYDTFKAYFDDMTPNSIEELCGIEDPANDDDDDDTPYNFTPFMVGLLATVAFLAGTTCALLATTLHYRKKAFSNHGTLMSDIGH